MERERETERKGGERQGEREIEIHTHKEMCACVRVGACVYEGKSVDVCYLTTMRHLTRDTRKSHPQVIPA